MKTPLIISSFLCLSMNFDTYCVFDKRNYDKPKFILIVADDLGYANLSVHGSKQIPTPHIDRSLRMAFFSQVRMFLPRYAVPRGPAC